MFSFMGFFLVFLIFVSCFFHKLRCIIFSENKVVLKMFFILKYPSPSLSQVSSSCG